MAALGSPIVIDGSHGEGGGALVRTALVMAALTQQPLRIDGVRTGTKYPGLDYEDLILMKALAHSTSAETVGAETGATSISFLPTKRARGLNGSLDLAEDEGHRRGAGALVVLNALLPVLARSGMYSQVAISGETYGHRTLGYDYFHHVTVPAQQRFGLYAFPDLELAGFGRESRGKATMDVEPSALRGQDWSTRGRLVGCRAIVTTAELASAVAERGAAHLSKLAENARIPMEVETNSVDSRSAGAYVTMWAQYENGLGGATAMGSKGLRTETLVQGAFEELLDWMSGDATMDPFLADQLLVTACVAEGDTNFKVNRLTSRLLTAIWVIKQFLPIHITVRGEEEQPGSISIRK